MKKILLPAEAKTTQMQQPYTCRNKAKRHNLNQKIRCPLYLIKFYYPKAEAQKENHQTIDSCWNSKRNQCPENFSRKSHRK